MSTMASSSNRFASFNILTTSYKVVHEHPIEVDVMIPKTLVPGTYPIMVRFHGGFFVTGSRQFPDWFQNWVLNYALQHDAIIVNADYRLLPEATGTELNQDLADLWKWVLADLASYLSTAAPGFAPDLSKIITIGESAGGYAAIQSGLTQPNVRAIIAAFPLTDIKDEYYSVAGEKNILGLPMLPASVVDDHIAAMKPTDVASSFHPPERLNLGLAMAQHGRFLEFFGDKPELHPLEHIERVSSVPPLFILHGRDDTGVPVKQSEAFVDKLKRLHPQAKVRLAIEPGEHGFDAEATLDTPWLKEGLEFITAEWL